MHAISSFGMKAAPGCAGDLLGEVECLMVPDHNLVVSIIPGSEGQTTMTTYKLLPKAAMPSDKSQLDGGRFMYSRDTLVTIRFNSNYLCKGCRFLKDF